MRHKTIMAALAFVIAVGGSYGGYTVLTEHNRYGAGFDERPHVVTRIIDGDTIEVDGEFDIRLLGVNAPEKSACYHADSKEVLTKLVLGKEVFLEKDLTATDGFKRLLRYVFIRSDDPEKDAIFVNGELIREGAVFRDTNKTDRRYHLLYIDLEQDAIAHQRGLWGEECEYRDSFETKNISPTNIAPPNASCLIKGNVSGKGLGKIYFLPGCTNYATTRINPSDGEQYFCSVKEAEAAGFVRSKTCDRL